MNEADDLVTTLPQQQPWLMAVQCVYTCGRAGGDTEMSLGVRQGMRRMGAAGVWTAPPSEEAPRWASTRARWEAAAAEMEGDDAGTCPHRTYCLVDAQSGLDAIRALPQSLFTTSAVPGAACCGQLPLQKAPSKKSPALRCPTNSFRCVHNRFCCDIGTMLAQCGTCTLTRVAVL